MNIKRILPIAALSLLILSACTQLPTDPYTGSYTFKTSGTVKVVVSADVSDEDAVKLEPKVYDLTTEVGRMDIKARGNDTMLVTMNVLGGDVYVFDAELTPGGFRLLLHDTLQVVAGSSDRTVVGGRCLRMPFAEVNAHQPKLVTQIEVVVNDNLFAILFRHEAQQTLAKDGF